LYFSTSLRDVNRTLEGLKDNVDFLNQIAIRKFPGQSTIFTSADSIFEDDNGDGLGLFTMEYLNSLNLPGVPSHKLELKIGAPVVLLRNLDPLHGLCNGTRMRVEAMSQRIITAKILNGSHVGTIALIPRIDLIPSDTRLPFKLKRRQFPIRLAFAMTINKAQGQSLEHCGIYLSRPVFGHGQMSYVALSRSGNPFHTKVLLSPIPQVQGLIPGKDGQYTKNVVFTEVISD
jgi:ATP-dependent DNA helicase PIF1